jgi:zinc transport system substrate-binding protein
MFLLPVCLPAAQKPVVFVSILPQKFFVQQIAGDEVEVNVMVGPGMSPATYEPLPQQMASLARARLFFAIGMPFEKTLVEKMQSVCPDVEVIKTDAGIEKRFMQSVKTGGRSHQHHEDCDHASGSTDPHIWLDPQLVKRQAESMAEALTNLLPEKKKVFTAGLKSFNERLEEIDQRLSDLLKPLKGKTMLVFHPAFGYFADRYGLVQSAVEIEGKEPSPRQMVKIIRRSKAEKVNIIFVQKQFSQKAAEAIASAINGAVVAIDPLQEDYFAGLESLAKTVSRSMQQ